MMLLDAGPLGNSSPLFCDLYEKKIVVSIICGTGDIFIFCGVAAFKLTQGRVRVPKLINFQKKIQTAFDRPPSFLENYVAIFFKLDTKPSKIDGTTYGCIYVCMRAR